METPAAFDEAFLDWFRDETEREWAETETPTLEYFAARGVGASIAPW